MGLTKYKLGDLIEQCDERNLEGFYSIDNIKGISTGKTFIETKANMDGVSLTSYKVVNINDFAYVADTSRRGDKIAVAFNNNEKKILISSIYTVFRVTKPDLILSDYLFMYFNRPEFDRFSRFNSWGSARETFSWEDLCDIDIYLPPLPIQQKYVEVYNAMLANQQCYERGLEDLKLVCDAYIDNLKNSKPRVPIRKYVELIDNKNLLNLPYKFKGLSMENFFIDSIADANGLDFTKYKIVSPDEYAAVLMKVGRDGRLTIARNTSDEYYLISPAYYTFKIRNINPEYFMANVNRSEFERRGWFSCDTSARGSLSWDEFMELTIPEAIEEEQQIVSELYEAQTTRFWINEKLKSQIKDICPILIKGSIEEAKKSKEA